jgi:hypothetical protein
MAFHVPVPRPTPTYHPGPVSIKGSRRRPRPGQKGCPTGGMKPASPTQQ